jgi:hypothetical protein
LPKFCVCVWRHVSSYRIYSLSLSLSLSLTLGMTSRDLHNSLTFQKLIFKYIMTYMQTISRRQGICRTWHYVSYWFDENWWTMAW